MGVFLEVLRANITAFWGPTTVQNVPIELSNSEYVLVSLREQNRAFILDFWVICDFSTVGGHFSPFLVNWGSVRTTFSKVCNSWGHPGASIRTLGSILNLTAPKSLAPAQSESLSQIWDRPVTHFGQRLTHLDHEVAHMILQVNMNPLMALMNPWVVLMNPWMTHFNC